MQLRYDLHTPNSPDETLSPVILLHSMAEDRRTWLHIAPEIATQTRRKVYAMDARNHGESEWTKEYGIDIMADDLNEFFCQHRIPQAIVLGHSIGGKVAMTFALKQPSKVEMLVIEDSTTKNFPLKGGKLVSNWFKMISDFMKQLPTSKDKKEVTDFLRQKFELLMPMITMPSELVYTYDLKLLPLEWNGQTFVLKINLDAITDALVTDKLQQNLSGEYKGDVLIIFGRKSEFKVNEDKNILKFFPRATFVEFENAGHFVHQQEPKEFTQVVIDFINSKTVQKSKY